MIEKNQTNQELIKQKNLLLMQKRTELLALTQKDEAIENEIQAIETSIGQDRNKIATGLNSEDADLEEENQLEENLPTEEEEDLEEEALLQEIEASIFEAQRQIIEITNRINQSREIDLKIADLEKRIQEAKKVGGAIEKGTIKLSNQSAVVEEPEPITKHTEQKEIETGPGTLDNPNVTVEDYIRGVTRLTPFGKELAQQNPEKYIEEGKQYATLVFKYMRGLITADEMLHTPPFNYSEHVHGSIAVDYANDEVENWKFKYDEIIGVSNSEK